MLDERLVIISPVRNEASHLPDVIKAMAAQTRRPDEWIAVDDGSDDGTREILERAASELPFLRVLCAPPDGVPEGADRLAHAAAPRVFNYGISRASEFTHVGKLDGDIELPPDYFERLLAKFREHPKLGIAGGIVVEQRAGTWVMHGTSQIEHVRGALRVYSRECLEAVGGVRETLGWDGIDVLLARSSGYWTQSFPELVARHHRPTGTAQGRMRGHLRWGRCQYVQGYPAYWVAARAVKVSAAPPRVVSGFAYLAGYGHAAFRRLPRFDEDGYRAHLRGELRARARKKLSSPPRGDRPSAMPVVPRPSSDGNLRFDDQDLPDVTVVIVSFNDSRWLEPCIRSLLGRAGDARIEIVVVDNGTDGAHRLVRSRLPDGPHRRLREPRVRPCEQPRRDDRSRAIRPVPQPRHRDRSRHARRARRRPRRRDPTSVSWVRARSRPTACSGRRCATSPDSPARSERRSDPSAGRTGPAGSVSASSTCRSTSARPSATGPRGRSCSRAARRC